MVYSIPPIPNRKRKKRTHYSGVFFVCMAFLAFIVIGLTVSISIRACSPHEKYVQEEANYHEDDSNTINIEPNEIPDISSDYVIPDSVIRICMPAPLKGISEQIIHKTAYIVSYNKETKVPNWVSWHLTADHTDGPIRRMSNFYEEEGVVRPRATLEDYRGSGWSRGHMCPAGDNKWNETAMYDSFSLVNVCPQHASLNSGLWNVIERDCRKWAKKYKDLYIVCGPVYFNRDHETIGLNKVVVPEAFYKVILRLTPEPAAIGFVVRNNEGKKKKDQFVNTVDDVERITGIDFFSALPDDIENKVESQADINDWK